MADRGTHVEEHEHVRKDCDESVLAGLLGDVVWDRPLGQIVGLELDVVSAFALCQLGFDGLDLIHELMIVVRAILRFVMIAVAESLVEGVDVSNEDILFPSLGGATCEIVIVQQEGDLQAGGLDQALRAVVLLLDYAG